MSKAPQNLVLEQLRLIRSDIAEVRSELSGRIDSLSERVENIDTQLQGLTYVMTTAVGSLVMENKDIKQRIEVLEGAR
ncbi:MAG: hypothetical protein ACRCWF_01055 [Beijerinckiaceae bacterium]